MATADPPMPPAEGGEAAASSSRYVATNRARCLLSKVGTNPWVQLFVYCLACLCTSCLYFGWQAYSELVIRSGAFAWVCEGQRLTPGSDDGSLCEAQSKKVSRLYAIANGSEFACAAVAGVLLDTLGPRLTATLGEGLHFLSIIGLIASGRSLRLYEVSMVLAGACVNIISFPALTVMEKWPDRQALAVSIIVGAQSSASIVAPILKAIWDRHPNSTYRNIWTIWLIAVWLPVSVLYIALLPKSRNYRALIATSVVCRDELQSTNSGRSLVEHEHPGATAEEAPPYGVYPGDMEEKENDSYLEIAPTQPVTPRSDRPVYAEANTTPLSAAHLATVIVPDMTRARDQWRAFLGSLKTLDIWLMACFCAMLMFQFAYYPAVVRNATSAKVSDVVSWLTPLQGPFSFMIGFIMDYSGTLLVMFTMCATLAFVNLSVSFAPHANRLQYVVAVWFIFIQSATYNIKYTFVNEMYDPYNFGKLVGVLGICGGIGVYCSNPLVELSSYSAIFDMMTGLVGLMVCLAIWLFVRQQMMKITHKTVKSVAQKHHEINNV